jgi:nucleoside-diphosphate-sugar epimerase
MRVIVTGGAGFIGTLLARRLLAAPVGAGDGPARPVGELVLADLAAPPPDIAADPRVRVVTGDLAATAGELRLMTVSVRPGKPNAAASGFLSGIIREPLAGIRATCPVPPGTPVALSSPRRTLEGILRAAAVSDTAWGSRTAMNLPALATTPQAMAEAMDRVAGYAASDLINWTDDPAIGAIVRSWPARIETPRAAALGLRAEASFDDIVREYRASQLAST